MGKRATVTCDWCGKEFQRYPCQIHKHNFCSRGCMWEFSTKAKNPVKYAELKSLEGVSRHMTALNKARTGIPMPLETRSKLSRARQGTGQKDGYLKCGGRHIHRIIAEVILGADLSQGHVVHHIDGNKQNNSPENLMVFQTQAEHARWHKEHDQEKNGGDAR